MTREFLTNLKIEGLTKDIIDQIMDEHGKTVTENKRASDETIRQLNEQLAQRADITIPDLEALRTSLTDAEGKLKTFEGVDPVDLNKRLTEAQARVTELESTHQAKVTELQTDALLREGMARITFSSDYARKGVYDDIKGKVKFEDGVLTGFDEAMAELREKQPSAFAVDGTETPPPKKEGKQHGGNTPPVKKEVPVLI